MRADWAHFYLAKLLTGEPYTLRGRMQPIGKVWGGKVGPRDDKLLTARMRSAQEPLALQWPQVSGDDMGQAMAVLRSATGTRPEEEFLIPADIVVMLSGRAALVDVRCPTGWEPEKYVGASFAHFHEDAIQYGLRGVTDGSVAALCSRTPILERWLWALTTCSRLDGHPRLPRCPWPVTDEFYLRVERQLTLAIPEVPDSFIFLIMPFLVHHSELLTSERVRLLATMESSIGTPGGDYKGFQHTLPHVERILR